MLRFFYPYEYAESVFTIDYRKLYEMGYRAVIFDVDNTLVHHGEDSTKEVDALFRKIHGTGLKTLILSNNSEKRIKKFLENIDSPYIFNAQKPKKEGYLKSLEMLNLKKNEAVMIGDQVFTDIFGANRCGIPNILVKFMRKESETEIGKKRKLEKIILKFYTKSRKFQNRIGDIEKKPLSLGKSSSPEF